MHDPATYIVFTAILCGSLGFFAACLVNARTVKRSRTEGWKEAVRFYQGKQS